MCSAITLHGTGVLVTRPQHQSENLRCLIEQAGGRAVVVPTIEIAEHRNLEKLMEVATQLNKFDIAIFISVNAVTKGLGWLERNSIPWPKSILVGAVGQSTANALKALGVTVNLVPGENFDSEGLLSLPVMHDIAGRKVIIFRGQGGRELLANTLKERGAHVEYAEVYERRRPDIRMSEKLNNAQRALIKVIVTTSNEGIENLVAVTDPDLREWLFNTSLIVLSERGATCAKALGFNSIAIAPQASDDAIIKTIKRIIEH